MTEYADLSLEIAHIYLHELDENKAEQSAKIAESWIKHILDLAKKHQRVVSTTVLIDNYFMEHSLSLPDAAEMIVSAYEHHGIQIDHIVPESSCASGIEKMFDLIIEQPRRGAGSRGGEIGSPARVTGWLSNGDSMRLTHNILDGDPFRSSGEMGEEQVYDPRYRHAVFLDVQLWSHESGRKIYSCAALAAWWQLMRLGLDEAHDCEPILPDEIMSRRNSPPFFSHNTLSILSSQFIEIEHAVNVILNQVFIPQSARKRWQQGRFEVGPPESFG